MTAYELRISAWSSDFFSSYLLSTIAVLIALSVVNIFEPGAGVDPVLARQLLVDAREGAGAIVSQSAESPSGVDAFLNIIPNNVFAAASANDILAIMFFALIFGIGLRLVNTPQAQRLQDAIEGIFHVAMQIGRASGRERGCQYVSILVVA